MLDIYSVVFKEEYAKEYLRHRMGGNMHIGEKVRKLREDRKWTQADLAKRSGLGQPYISKIENQGIKGPSLGTISSIATALGVDVATLVDGTTYNSDLAEKLSEEQIGYCPHLQCPGSNWPELSAQEQEGATVNYIRDWAPYVTFLVDEDGEPNNFCVHCGTKLIAECRECGRKFRRLNRHCAGCGKVLVEADDDDAPF
jgi:transcriptional regulator with XRE-family HTH domain